MLLRNRLWDPSSLPLAFHHGLFPVFLAKHLDISEEPRGWVCYLFSQNAVSPPRISLLGFSKKPRKSRWRPWWDITKAAKLVGLWETGAAHTTLQVIPGKPDFPSVLSLSLAVS